MDHLERETWLRFVHGDAFWRKWAKLGLTDDDLRRLELSIIHAPRHPPVIQGTGGLRKLRYADEKTGRGKSGAYRVCYVYFQTHGIVLLATVFGKNEADNLTAADKAGMAKLIRTIQNQLESGLIR